MLKNAFHLDRLKTLPWGWRIFWGFFVVIVVLTVIQEATFVFYGPNRVVLGMHRYETTVSCDWPYTLLYLLVVIAWLFAYCATSLIKQLAVLFSAISIIVLLGVIISKFYYPSVLFSSTTVYNVGPGHSWYGQVESEVLLRWIADPFGEFKQILTITIIGIWFLPLLIPDLKLRRIEKARLLNICFYCKYDLRGSTGGKCPECGKDQPLP